MQKNNQTVFKTIFLLGLFVMPFVFWPFSKPVYEVPRVWFMERWVELLAIISLLSLPKILSRKTPADILQLLIAIFVLIAFIASLTGVDFGKSFWGNPARRDGLITLFHTSALFYLICINWRKEWINSFYKTVGASSILISIWTVVWGYAFHALKIATIPNWEGAIGVSFRQPVFLTGYLLVTIPFLGFLISQASKRLWRWIWIAGLVAQIIAIFLTKASAGVMGIGVFLLLWQAILKRQAINIWLRGLLSPKKSRLIVFYLITVSLLLVFIAPSVFVVKQKLDNFKVNYQAQARERIIVKGLIGFSKKPFLGWGWANFAAAFESNIWPYPVRFDIYVDKAHSHFLEILVTTGIVGFILYLAVIWRVLKNLFQNKTPARTYLILVFVMFILHSQTNVISISEEVFFWIIAGISARYEFRTFY